MSPTHNNGLLKDPLSLSLHVCTSRSIHRCLPPVLLLLLLRIPCNLRSSGVARPVAKEIRETSCSINGVCRFTVVFEHRLRCSCDTIFVKAVELSSRVRYTDVKRREITYRSVAVNARTSDFPRTKPIRFSHRTNIHPQNRHSNLCTEWIRRCRYYARVRTTRTKLCETQLYARQRKRETKRWVERRAASRRGLIRITRVCRRDFRLPRARWGKIIKSVYLA